MSNILQSSTSHRRDKIKEMVSLIGNPASKPIIQGNLRNHVRSLLSGFGIPSENYLPASLEQLQTAYHSIATDWTGFIHFVFAMKAQATFSDVKDCLTEIRTRYFFVCSDQPLAPLPSDETITALMSLHAMTEQKPEVAQAETVSVWIEESIPATKAAKPDQDKAKQVMELLAELMGATSKTDLTESKVIQLIKQHAIATELKIKTDTSEVTIPTGLHHKLLPDVLMTLKAGINVYLVGQAGAGKTTMAIQIAKALNLTFYFNGALDSEYKLTGFMDAQGRYVRTAFRNAYENGGLYLFDELDASSASALLAFNAALENGHSDFPDGCVTMHKDFKCIAAANTYGTGADRVYIGRNQLDGAFLDRFAFIEMPYDEKLERALTGNDTWCDYVQSIRRAIKSQKIRHIVSPRASIKGAQLLAIGQSQGKVEDQLIWKGLDSDSVSKIKAAA